MTDFQEVISTEPLEGDITQPILQNPTAEDEYSSTLDEPVRDTIMRDLRAVMNKFSHIIYPRKDSELLHDWDLWGPLLLCVVLAVLLQQGSAVDAEGGSRSPQFTEVFVSVWAGAAVVTLNSQLLGGKLSFFQSVCVLGYCIFPMVVAMILLWSLVHIAAESIVIVSIKIIVTGLAYGWSVYASTLFLGDSQPTGKKALAVYPICLFYFLIAWMVATYSHE